ncbi:hypothetical protein Ddye_018374 [Dipteronia dyeriana]|uniref:Uncharacterized protein n=1 Tax=Dipteronia dyeriana TaxID=168575 RepID=A0AAD9UAY2_9ROSI|nr:hypothetical protein Ddye_018374 [Dipteronia dyeriana]
MQSLENNQHHIHHNIGLLYPYSLTVRDKINPTFVLEDHGKGIRQKKGCFSGRDKTTKNASSINNIIMLFGSGSDGPNSGPQPIYVLQQASYDLVG